MNDKGFLMPLMLGISFIFASLLLTMAGRLESQAYSYGRRQLYQQIAVLEMEAVQRISHWLNQQEDFPATTTLSLESGIPVDFQIQQQDESLQITYRLVFDGHLGTGTFRYQVPSPPDTEDSPAEESYVEEDTPEKIFAEELYPEKTAEEIQEIFKTGDE